MKNDMHSLMVGNVSVHFAHSLLSDTLLTTIDLLGYYSTCHRRKLDRRCSPLVRMITSGSGNPS